MRLVFLGAGEFGVPSLEALGSRHQIALVVSQPDRPAGRGKSLAPTPLARRAAELGLSVVKPADVNASDVREALRAVRADAWVVIAFGQKLSRELLDGVFAINLHGSILPAYRGAAPIQRAVMDGCVTTGVSVISLAERMDAGLVYAVRTHAVRPTSTASEIHDELATLGPEALESTLEAFAAGSLRGDPQDESRATRARKLSKAEATVDVATLPAGLARARINGLNDWPGCAVRIGGLDLRLRRAGEAATAEGVRPGVLGPDGRVGAAEGAIELLEVQVPGGRPMAFGEFVRGRPGLVGQKLERVDA